MEDTNLKLEALKLRNYDMYRYFKRGLEIISILKSKMFEAYIVGGAVRDFILNIDFNDIDIATNATPDDVKKIFTNVEIDDRYSHLGAITLKEDNFKYEITTFRNEEYVKCKIKDVHYSKKLVEDIIRRDFTINALAMTPNMTIVDLVDGQKDLERKIVKVIGSGKRRFKDDPSRILRGLILVAKFGYSLDSNTIKGMRKTKIYLKELSDNKIMVYMKKILLEKYGLRALKVIDDNNLFKFLPNYSYWVRLLIKNYRKLEYLEKITLLYRIMGNVAENNGCTKTENNQIKNLFDLSQHITVNLVDPMLVFVTSKEDLLSADRICKAYNHRYRSQKKEIKKIDKKLPIRVESELEISSIEIAEMLNGDNSKISYVKSELLYLVVNGEVDNQNKVLKECVYKILSGQYQRSQQITIDSSLEKKTRKKHSFKMIKKQNIIDDKYFDDEDEEEKLYSKIYEEYNDDEIENEDNLVNEVSMEISTQKKLNEDVEVIEENDDEDVEVIEENDEEETEEALIDNDVIQLKNEYIEDFKQLYQIYIKGIENYEQMSSFEREMREAEIKVQIRKLLLSTNSKYQLLEERKLI